MSVHSNIPSEFGHGFSKKINVKVDLRQLCTHPSNHFGLTQLTESVIENIHLIKLNCALKTVLFKSVSIELSQSEKIHAVYPWVFVVKVCFALDVKSPLSTLSTRFSFFWYCRTVSIVPSGYGT